MDKHLMCSGSFPLLHILLLFSFNLSVSLGIPFLSIFNAHLIEESALIFSSVEKEPRAGAECRTGLRRRDYRSGSMSGKDADSRGCGTMHWKSNIDFKISYL